jgi:hypothetical protein
MSIKGMELAKAEEGSWPVALASLRRVSQLIPGVMPLEARPRSAF